MGRPKSLGPYTPLAASYYLDDAILEAREHAELLFVRCLSYLAAGDSDGFITELQMLHAVGVGLRAVPKRVETLIDVGLLVRVDGGYVVRSYLKWNKSAEEIGRYRKLDRERKARKTGEDAPDSDRNPDGIHPDSAPHDTALHDTALHEPLVDVPPTQRITDADFDRAYQHWPKKAERQDALNRFRAAAKRRGTDVVIADVARFGQAYVAAGIDKQFVPSLGRWLKNERWSDELPQREAPAGRSPQQERPAMTTQQMKEHREAVMNRA